MSQRFRVDEDYFDNAPRVDADIFFVRIKKMRFKKDQDTCGRACVQARLDAAFVFNRCSFVLLRRK